VPPCLVDHEESVRAVPLRWRFRPGAGHRLDVAEGRRVPRPCPLWADGAEDVGRGGALIVRGRRPRAAFGQRRVILFFCQCALRRRTKSLLRPDRGSSRARSRPGALGSFFIFSTAPSAWHDGADGRRACDSHRGSSRLNVCLATMTRNSSNTIGTDQSRASAPRRGLPDRSALDHRRDGRRCVSLSLEGCPGDLRSIRPSGHGR